MAVGAYTVSWRGQPAARLATGNTRPVPASVDIAFKDGKSVQASPFTSDGQCVVNFNAGAFAPHGNDTAVQVAITPLDPTTLGRTPPGLAADGDAYRVELIYKPSSTALDSITRPAALPWSRRVPARCCCSRATASHGSN